MSPAPCLLWPAPRRTLAEHTLAGAVTYRHHSGQLRQRYGLDRATRRAICAGLLTLNPNGEPVAALEPPMAKGINKVILVGHLGRDPETRYTNSGTAVCTLSIATSENWKDRNSGERQERTEWHRVILWGKLGEIAQQYLAKGALVYIEGRLQTRKWQDRDGQDRYTTEVVASDMQMLGGRGDRHEPAPPQPSGATADQYRAASGGTAAAPPPPSAGGGGIPDNDFDDDIPF